MLAGDADREHTVNVLREAFTEGRLKQEEYVDRVGRAYQARTYADLDAITADIPVPPAFRPAPPTFYYGPRPTPTVTNGNATASLVCGVLGLMTGGLTSIPAIVLGHVAKRQIRERGESGDGMATGGLILGYLVAIVMAVTFGAMALAVTALT